MAYEIDVIDNPTDFAAAVGEVQTGARNELILGKWQGGLLEFAGVAFPGVDPNDIYAKHHKRESTGRDPHFDVYKEFVDAQKPWAGHFNLSGNAALETVLLPDDIAAVYESRYPVQNAESAEARRHLSRFALEAPDANVGTGSLEALTRFVLPVRPKGPHIVHNIVPKNPDKPGEFVKLIAPPRSSEERDDLRSIDYMPLDTFLTQALSAAIRDVETAKPAPAQPTIQKAPLERRAARAPYIKPRCQGID